MRAPRLPAVFLTGFLAGVSLHAVAAETALDRARALRRAGSLEAAAEVLLEAATTEPGESSAAVVYRELGQVRLEQRRGMDAARQFEKALEAVPGQGVVHYQAGLAFRMAGQKRHAVRHLRQAVGLGFRTAGALLHLTAAQLELGRLGAGLRTATELLATNPRSSGTLSQLGKILFDRFFYRDALRVFEAALQIEPESFEVRLLAALTSQLLNRHEDAVRLLADLDQVTAESLTLLASAHAQLGDIAAAQDLFEEAVRKFPASPHAYLNLAFFLLERDRLDEAEANLAATLRSAAGASPKVFYAVGSNSCDALADALRARHAELDQDRADAYFGLAASLASRQHHGTAVAVLRLAMRREGPSPRVMQLLARSCLHLDPQSAAPMRILEKLLRTEPGDPEARHLLGRAYLRQDRVEEAVEAHHAAVLGEPENSLYRTELGRSYAGLATEAGQAQAISAFRMAAELDPRNAVARYELGRLLYAEGRLEDAVRALEEAVAIEPEFHNAHYVLVQAHQRAGRKEAAKRHLARFQETREAAEARAGATEGFSNGL